MAGRIDSEDYSTAHKDIVASLLATASCSAVKVTSTIPYQTREGLPAIGPALEAVEHSFVTSGIYLEHDSATLHASAEHAEVTAILCCAVKIALGVQH